MSVPDLYMILSWAALAMASASFIVLWIAPRWLLQPVFLISVSASLAFMRLAYVPSTRGSIQQLAFLGAALCLFWSLWAALLAHVRSASSRPAPSERGFEPAVRMSALLFGVLCAIVQCVVLAMRLVLYLVDMFRGIPTEFAGSHIFPAYGLWSLAMLAAACVVSLWSTRNTRLITCLFWILVGMTTWSCLLFPAVYATSFGGYVRGPASLVATFAVALVAFSFAFLTTGRTRAADADHGVAARGVAPAGLRSSCAALAVAIVFAVCYHMVVPIPVWGLGHGFTALWVAVSAALAGAACMRMAAHDWSPQIADAGIGLWSLSLPAACLIFVPGMPTLDATYPLIFNSIMVGLGAGALLLTWLACKPVWPPGIGVSGKGGHWVPHLKRMAFFNAVVALLAGAAMAVWPRMTTVAAMDHSYGRVIAGVAGNLFLLFVTLWCSRHLRRLTFHLLTVLIVFSLGWFLAVRMLPFASRIG